MFQNTVGYSAAGPSSFEYWESGAWRGGLEDPAIGFVRRGVGAATGGPGMITGLAGGMILGAALKGGMLGAAGGPIGFAIGAVAGMAVGGAIWAGGGMSIEALQGALAKKPGYEFRMPFVNTRVAATMRQAAMQTMMMSANSYRQILGREASRLHR